MLAGKPLDHADFIRETGSWRLAAVIRDLRRLGWPVQATDEAATAADGHRQDIARYSFGPETLVELRQSIGECPHCAHKAPGTDFFRLAESLCHHAAAEGQKRGNGGEDV
jgi:hypothetical protein